MFSVVLTFPTAFNILMNFGIAITYPTLISLGIVLSVPVNASKSPPRPNFSIWTHLIFHDTEIQILSSIFDEEYNYIFL